jgi:hypothetical protein
MKPEDYGVIKKQLEEKIYTLKKNVREKNIKAFNEFAKLEKSSPKHSSLVPKSISCPFGSVCL